MIALEELVDALGPHLVSTADRISARLGLPARRRAQPLALRPCAACSPSICLPLCALGATRCGTTTSTAGFKGAEHEVGADDRRPAVRRHLGRTEEDLRTRPRGSGRREARRHQGAAKRRSKTSSREIDNTELTGRIGEGQRRRARRPWSRASTGARNSVQHASRSSRKARAGRSRRSAEPRAARDRRRAEGGAARAALVDAAELAVVPGGAPAARRTRAPTRLAAWRSTIAPTSGGQLGDRRVRRAGRRSARRSRGPSAARRRARGGSGPRTRASRRAAPRRARRPRPAASPAGRARGCGPSARTA